MSLRPRVLVFARAPVSGRVKTRLARDVGDALALRIYQTLGATVLRALTSAPDRPYDVSVRVTPDDALDVVQAWISGADAYEPQGDGDLGARLARATHEAFQRGHRAVVLVGTDCPAVTDRRVREALLGLETHPAMLGPARDGGYYLLALARELPVFDGVPWSTDAVAECTRARLRAAGATWGELPVETDVDTLADLAALEAYRND